MLYDGDPFIALDQFKELAFRACAKVWLAILTKAPLRLLLELSSWLLVLPCVHTETG